MRPPGGRELDALSSTTCVVTGGLGFIGSNLVHALVAVGAEVRVIDACIPHHGGDARNLDGLEAVEVLRADIADPSAADLVAGADVVFNLAGQVSHQASMQDPLLDLDLNVRSHVAFLETLRRVAPAIRIVLTSTRQIYGQPERLPVDETHPAHPVDVNGVDKLACEQLHLLYGRVHGLRPTALRLTNVYGPRQNLLKPDLGVLPVFIRLALQGEPIQLFGDGLQRRDCVHVDDIVRALALATGEQAVGEVINIGHPVSSTLREIAEALMRATGSRSAVEYVPWPPELIDIDIGDFEGDYAKAARVLGWKPTLDLEDGIAHTIAFYRRHPWYLSST